MRCSENYACAVNDCNGYACSLPDQCAEHGLIYSEFHPSSDLTNNNNHVTNEGKKTL